jgi:hypothetical protein
MERSILPAYIKSTANFPLQLPQRHGILALIWPQFKPSKTKTRQTVRREFWPAIPGVYFSTTYKTEVSVIPFCRKTVSPK